MSKSDVNDVDACFVELNALGYRITAAYDLLVESASSLPQSNVAAEIDPEHVKNKFLVKSMWEYLY